MLDIENIHHVIWQPTIQCSNNCKNCYVKAAAPTEQINTEVIKSIYKEKSLRCSQFTISLNSFITVDQQTLELAEILKELWNYYETDNLPQLCITAKDIQAIEKWHGLMELSFRLFLKPLTLLSLSNLPVLGKNAHALKERCEEENVKLNYNKVIKKDLTESKAFRMGCRYSHQVYLILQKGPLGEAPSKESIANWLKALKIAESEAKEVEADHCLRDGINFNKKHISCSASKDKIHVWPDGTITGCPYDSYCKVPYNSELHPIYKCKIPEIIEEIKDKQPEKKMVAQEVNWS